MLRGSDADCDSEAITDTLDISDTNFGEILVVLLSLSNLVVMNYIETSAPWGESSLLAPGIQVVLSRFSLCFPILFLTRIIYVP